MSNAGDSAEPDTSPGAEIREAVDRALGTLPPRPKRLPRHVRLPDDNSVGEGLRPRREFRRVRDKLGQSAHAKKVDMDALIQAYLQLTPQDIADCYGTLKKLRDDRNADSRTREKASELLLTVPWRVIEHQRPAVQKQEISHSFPKSIRIEYLTNDESATDATTEQGDVNG